MGDHDVLVFLPIFFFFFFLIATYALIELLSMSFKQTPKFRAPCPSKIAIRRLPTLKYVSSYCGNIPSSAPGLLHDCRKFAWATHCSKLLHSVRPRYNRCEFYIYGTCCFCLRKTLREVTAGDLFFFPPPLSLPLSRPRLCFY